MAAGLTTPNTLYEMLQTRTSTSRLVAGIVAAIAGSMLLALAAKIQVPVWPVPVTLATLAVALIAGAAGWRIGVASVVLYIVEGLSGLPVFANGGGPAYILSPTFGFIIGFVPMAYLIGRASEASLGKKILPMLAIMLAADAICLVFGYAWLVAFSGGATWIDQTDVLGSAFAQAVQPFLIWDALKMALAAITVSGASAVLLRR
ncbi:MAG: hypothetical protein JWR75_2042 [Devosia sp.]|nr:hypothetical protein [Devosia sp.]